MLAHMRKPHSTLRNKSPYTIDNVHVIKDRLKHVPLMKRLQA
jgi:hypothetical protein